MGHNHNHYQHIFISFQTHLTFGTEFTHAVEMKQVEQQSAERARYLVEKVNAFDFITEASTIDHLEYD